LVGWIAGGEVIRGSSFFFGLPLPFLMADWLDGWIGTAGVQNVAERRTVWLS
jgi:hypothetical protein